MTTIKSKKVCEGHVGFSTHNRLGNECKVCFYYRKTYNAMLVYKSDSERANWQNCHLLEDTFNIGSFVMNNENLGAAPQKLATLSKQLSLLGL